MLEYILIQQALIMQGDSQPCVIMAFCINMYSSIQMYIKPTAINDNWQHMHQVETRQMVT